MRRFEWLLVALLAPGCEDEGTPAGVPSEAVSVPSIERPVVELVGCQGRTERSCLLAVGSSGEAALGLWVDVEAAATISVAADDRPLSPDSRPADEGRHLRLRIPEGASTLRVEGLEPAWSEPLVITLDWERTPKVVEEARERAVVGKDEPGARAMLEEALATAEGPARLAVLQLLRKLGTTEADVRRRYAEEAVVLAQSLGRERDLANVASALTFELIRRRSLADARRWVQRMDELSPTVPEARVWASYQGGLLAAAGGDLTEAVRRMAEAERWAGRLGMTKDWVSALDQHAVLLSELGRADEALAVVRRGLELVEPMPCSVRARVQGNLAWAQLLLVQQGLHHEVPRQVLERSLHSWEHECPQPTRAAFQRVNLALAALVDGEPEQAHALYQRLRAEGVPSSLDPWVDELGAQVGLATGRWETMPSVLLRPEPTDELGLDWSIAVRRASTLSALGLHDAAIEAYQDAEHMLDEAVAAVGVDVGKELFLSGRSASARGLVRELVVQGRASQALCRTRIARRRALRTVDRAARIASLSPSDRARWNEIADRFLETQAELQRMARDDWALSGTQQQHQQARREQRHREATAALDDAMRTLLREDEVVDCGGLPSWPSDERLLVVTATSDEVIVLAAASPDSVSLATAPIGASVSESVEVAVGSVLGTLEGAARIRLLVDGSSGEVRWPALRVGDRALVDVAPLVHSLDLFERVVTPVEARRALVVADPSEDLPAARAEADSVAEILATAKWSVDRRTGVEATREALIPALEEAALLHYAGHGRHGGRAGWGAALLLHEGELLATDLLAVPRVPPVVVLAGCETGSHSADAWAGGVNLGRAFVLAGATQVLVAEGRIEDDLARRASEGLARRLAEQPSLDLGSALRRVQLHLREDEPSSEWWRLKVLVP